MEFKGLVYKVLPVVKGQGARGEWVKQEVVFEQPDEFNRKLVVGFWGDKAQDAAALKPGEMVEVAVNLESREYNGRWYNDIRAWKVERGAAPVQVDTPIINAPKVEVPDFSKAENDPDELPF